MSVLDQLKELRTKLKKMQEPQTSSLKSNVNDEVSKKMVALMNDHDEMKNVLKLIREKNSKVTIKKIKYVTKIQNVEKRLNDLCQENKMLEKYISETKGSEALEKIKRENNCLTIKYKEANFKNTQHNDEKLNDSQLMLDGSNEMPIHSHVLCDTPLLLLDLNNDYMGFDSMTTSTIEKQIDPQCVSYRSQYHKFRKHSTDAQNTADSLLDLLKQSNVSFEREIQNVTFVTNQISSRVRETEEHFTRILNNQEITKTVMRNLEKGRRIWEQIYFRNADYLNVLESDINSLKNCVEMKLIPTYFTSHNNNCSFSDLEKLSIEELYRKWSKMIILRSPVTSKDATIEN